MDTTFDINKVREETLQGPATWGQCNKLGRIWSENNGKKELPFTISDNCYLI